jgi:hypothetical protein
MEFKAGVSLKDLKPQTVLALIVAEREYSKFGVTNMVVTAINNGDHKVGSLHGSGFAVDLRTKPVGLARQLVEAIRNKLKPLGFDVLFEYEGQDREHCHIEYDPKE